MSNEDIMIQLADSQELLKSRMESLTEEIKYLKTVIRSTNSNLEQPRTVLPPLKKRQYKPLDDELELEKRAALSSK
jgi:hypothetical protein